MTPRQGVLHGLQQPVADHALGLGTEGVEGVGLREPLIVGGLQGEDAHLGAVTVGEDQLVLLC